MATPIHNDKLYGFLTDPDYRLWRYVLFMLALIPIGLSQSFYVFGNHAAIADGTIYLFGLGFSAITLAIVCFMNYCCAPLLLPKGGYLSYFLVLLLLVSGFVFMKYHIAHQIFSSAGLKREFNGVTVLDGLSNLMTYTVCITSGAIGHLLKQWTSDHETIGHLEQKQLKNKVDELKSRIRPQFLYNTLHHASNQVRTEPEQTSDTLLKLSTLLKYQLYDAARSKVLLSSDIAFIRLYLQLEQKNAGNNFNFTVVVTGDTHKMIPPGLFIPWIEEITLQHPLHIEASFAVEQALVRFTCRVRGADLSHANFRDTEQKLQLLNLADTLVERTTDRLHLQFRLC